MFGCHVWWGCYMLSTSTATVCKALFKGSTNFSVYIYIYTLYIYIYTVFVCHCKSTRSSLVTRLLGTSFVTNGADFESPWLMKLQPRQFRGWQGEWPWSQRERSCQEPETSDRQTGRAWESGSEMALTERRHKLSKTSLLVDKQACMTRWRHQQAKKNWKDDYNQYYTIVKTRLMGSFWSVFCTN